MDLERWESQMRKGNLELVLMTLLMNEGEKYGLDIISCLKERFEITVVEGTLYPIMNRMQEEGFVVARWELGHPGHPRKFYSITKKGKAAVAVMDEKLNEFIVRYNRVKAGNSKPTPRALAQAK